MNIQNNIEKLEYKTYKYRDMLSHALDNVNICVFKNSSLYKLALEIKIMSKSYYDDGNYFITVDDYVNALASFSYGYGWLDAGVRIGLFSITNQQLFSI